MKVAPALIWLLTPAAALACKCLATYPVCDAVAVADYVFVGRVESIQPEFPDPWKPVTPADVPVGEIARLQKERSPDNLAALRSLYLRMFPNLKAEDPDLDRQLRGASTYDELEKAFTAITSRGKRVRLSVLAVYKSPKDDDRPAGATADDDDDKPAPKTLEVWTDPGDCGFAFQKGETYLVYADDDEETGRLETSICSRTKRLSNAGADLSYLFFLRSGGPSSRIEGFLTSDRGQDAAQFPDRIESPVSGRVVELQTSAGSTFTTSDSGGRFIFDGLAGGDYDVSVHDSAYPRSVRLLAGPRAVRVKPRGCAGAVLVVPPGASPNGSLPLK